MKGGYFYFTPVGNPTSVFKLGHDSAGVPVFSRVGQTPETSAGRVGVGIPTITSLNGKPGTGILWMAVSHSIIALGHKPSLLTAYRTRTQAYEPGTPYLDPVARCNGSSSPKST